MALFVLVHGVCVGGWSWDLVTPHLESGGHSVLALDLPGDDPNANFSDYAEVILDALPGGDDIVLVGHSTGGLATPIVASRRTVAGLVFLCGAIPVPGESVAERGVEWRVIDPAEWQIYNDDGSFSISPRGFRDLVAPDAPADVIDQTIPLLKPQFLTPFLEPCPLDRMPDVPIRSIYCADDHIVGPDYARRAAHDMLGVEPIELPGSHSPMASRPEELARTLMAGVHG